MDGVAVFFFGVAMHQRIGVQIPLLTLSSVPKTKQNAEKTNRVPGFGCFGPRLRKSSRLRKNKTPAPERTQANRVVH